MRQAFVILLAVAWLVPEGFAAEPPAGNFYTRFRANDAPVGGRFTVFGYFLDTLDVAVAGPGNQGRPLLLLFRDANGKDSFLVPGDLNLEDSRGRRLRHGLHPLIPARIAGELGSTDTRYALWWVPRERDLGETDLWKWDDPTELRLWYGYGKKGFVPLAQDELGEVIDLVPFDSLASFVPEPDRPNSAVAWAPDPVAFDVAPEVKRLRRPRYPDSARRYNLKGLVRVVATVDTTGTVIDAFVVDTNAAHELNVAALAAVKSWEFHPARKNGRRVRAQVLVPVNFAEEKNR
jgi:TonB family protein